MLITPLPSKTRKLSRFLTVVRLSKKLFVLSRERSDIFRPLSHQWPCTCAEKNDREFCIRGTVKKFFQCVLTGTKQFHTFLKACEVKNVAAHRGVLIRAIYKISELTEFQNFRVCHVGLSIPQLVGSEIRWKIIFHSAILQWQTLGRT